MATDHVKETNQTFDRSATVGRMTLNRRLVTAATESLLQENNWRKTQMRFIGVDLHSNSLTACYLDQNGSEEMRTFDLKELVKFQASLAARTRSLWKQPATRGISKRRSRIW